MAPAGTPQAVVDRLREAIRQAQAAKPVLDQFAREGADIVQMTQAEFAPTFIQSEMDKWQQVVKKSGMKAQSLDRGLGGFGDASGIPGT